MCHGKDNEHVFDILRLTKSIRLILAILMAFVFLLCGSGHAGQVALTWDVNTDADYYEVYWGTTSGVVEGQSGNIGHVTSYQVENLQDGQTYYFSVKAFNSCGNSSDFSTWISANIAASDDSTSTATDMVDGAEDTTGGTGAEGGTDVASDVSEPSTDGVIEEDTTVSDTTLASSPGEKSADGFVPQAATALLEDGEGNPTIEVLDTQFNHLFWLQTGWRDYNELNGESRVVMGDIDNDGKDELVIGYAPVGSDSMVPGGFFQVLDHDYRHLAWGRVEWGDYNTNNGETRPSCGDIDGDGDDEIIIGLGPQGKGYMEVFDFKDGTLNHQSWVQVQWQEYNDINGAVRPVCGDVDGDGIDEIIVGLSSENGTAEMPAGNFETFGFDSTAWNHLSWAVVEWPEYNEINGETWPEFGDLDGDGQTELVVGLGYGSGGQLAVFEFQDGAAVQSYWAQIEWPEYNELTGETRPVCGDIDMDGKDEVLVGWSTPLADDETATYIKVLSYNIAGKVLYSLRDSGTKQVDIDSSPVKGALSQNDTIVMGLTGTLSRGQSSLPSSGTTSDSTVSGSEGGGGGCFIRSSH